jgi:RNA polymerase sigma-70 factor
VESPDPVVLAIGRRWGSALLAPASRFVERARDVWAELAAPDPDLVIASLELQEFDGTAEHLEQLDAAEIWLCGGCAGGHGRAISAFDRRYIEPLDGALGALGLDSAGRDDVKQRVRDKLLSGDDPASSRLLGYVGRGRLPGLVKVVAMRAALDRLRSDRRHAARTDRMDAVDRLIETDLGPELRAIEDQHQGEVKAAFEAAVHALGTVDRGILRLHLLEGAVIDDIAALHGVHRSTAARWLDRIRATISNRVREELGARLRLDPSALASLFRAVDSRIDLSLSRVLGVTAETFTTNGGTPR